jgi:DNA mismatch endonuclease (patch repair protein)
MADLFPKEVRSAIMSRIKSKNTRCELILRDTLEHEGISSFEMHYPVIGKPDIAFPISKVAVFCDSDFWHGKSKVPKTNQPYWKMKFQKNKLRDKLVNRELKKLGWKTIRLTEKRILSNPSECVNIIINHLHS